MSDVCASVYKNTNPNDEFKNSCSFNISKVQDKKLSSHSSLSQECDQNILNSGDLQNKEYFATKNWELYSEANMKCFSLFFASRTVEREKWRCHYVLVSLDTFLF